MTKQEYLAELNTHLMSLSSEERENAVRFYEEYFEDAGAENEQTVMDELGKPYALAKSIICEQSAYSKSLSYAKYRESKSLAQSEPIENNSAAAEEDVMPQKAASEQQDSPHTQYTAYNYSYENNNTNTNNNDTASSKYNTSYESYDEYKENYGSSSTANSSASNTSNTAYKTKSYKSDGDVAGIKSATILVEGENAYGYLKGEMGIHRLVRVSPFDSSGRRHTSFASVEVMPEIDDDVDVEIRDEDIKMDVYRASGAGGQKVNKTSSAVRLTHIPTGIVVSCQIERSQHQNREVAMRMLKSKLVEIKERENLERIEDIKGDQKEIAWGSQIRSYVFMPYTMVKDHRTNFEMGNITAVMDGDLDGFINAYLKMKSVEGVE